MGSDCLFLLFVLTSLVCYGDAQDKDGDCSRKLMAISQNPILIGQTVPQCDKDGNYKARQCSGSTGSCWCVDKLTGKEIESVLDVDKNGLPLCADGDCRRKLMAISKNPILIGQTVPQCDKNGNYKARQCSGSTGSCWCVDKLTGKEIEYSDVDKNGLPLCEPNCIVELRNVPSILVQGVPVSVSDYVPECDQNTGYFLPKQCLKNKKQCWCVSKLGKEIENTRSTQNISCPT